MLKGDLSTTPLAPLLIDLARVSATGSLIIVADDGEEAQLYLKAGLVYAVQVPGARPQLGSKLVSSGALAPEALADALEAQRTELQGWRLGELLVHLGYVEQTVVEAFVKEQVNDAMWDLMRWHDGRWRFRKNMKTREDVAPPMEVVDLLSVLRERGYEWETISSVVHGPSAVPTLSTGGIANPETVLDPEAWSMLCKIDGERSVADLARDCGYTLFEAGHVIVSLVHAGLVDIEEDVDVSGQTPYGASTLSAAWNENTESAEGGRAWQDDSTMDPTDDAEGDALSRLARLVTEVAGGHPAPEVSDRRAPTPNRTLSEPWTRGVEADESFAVALAKVSSALIDVLGPADPVTADPFELPSDLRTPRKHSTSNTPHDPEWDRRSKLRSAAAAELAAAHALAEALRPSDPRHLALVEAEPESSEPDAVVDPVEDDQAAQLAAEEEAEAARLAAEEEAARLAAEAEAARIAAEEEAARVAAEEAEAARLAAEEEAARVAAEAEAARIAAEEEAARLAAEEEARLAAEEEAARLAAEEEAARLAAEEQAVRVAAEEQAETARLAAEEEVARLAAEEEARLAAEEEAARLAAEEEARLAAEEEAARLAAEEEAARLAAEEEAARLAAEEEARLAAEEEAARLAAEEEAARLATEEEAAQLAAEEASRLAAEEEAARLAAEEEAARLAAEEAEAARLAAEKAEAARLAEEEAARVAAAEEEARLAAEAAEEAAAAQLAADEFARLAAEEEADLISAAEEAARLEAEAEAAREVEVEDVEVQAAHRAAEAIELDEADLRASEAAALLGQLSAEPLRPEIQPAAAEAEATDPPERDTSMDNDDDLYPMQRNEDMADTAALLRELSSLGNEDDDSDSSSGPPPSPRVPQRPANGTGNDKKQRKKIGLFGL